MPNTRANKYRPLSPRDEEPPDLPSSPPEGLILSPDDDAETVRMQRFDTHKTPPHAPPAYYMRAQAVHTDLSPRIPHQASLSAPQSPSEEDSPPPFEEAVPPTPRASNKPNLRDGRVRVRPRGCALISFILACFSLVLLGLVGHSFLNLQRDPKGCKMSFMYPSYAKLSNFDTEHTRFATKYSLYLYREQKMDVSLEVFSPCSLLM
jgi:hypothetical protein